MYALEKPAPRWEELIPARADVEAVEVLFPPQPSPKAIRKAREAVEAVYRAGGPDLLWDAGDAFTREILRWSILDWRGIGDADKLPVSPTQDSYSTDPETGVVTLIETGTITAFLGEPRLVDAADRKFVIPWTRRDAEKNGYAPSPSGTSAGAMPEGGTARRSATRRNAGDAKTTKRAPRSASTKNPRSRPTTVKPSGN